MSISRKFGRVAVSLGSVPSRLVNATEIKRLFIAVLLLVAALGTGGSVYYFQQYTALKSNPNAEAEKQSTALIAALGRHIELPQDEVPSVVTIVDKTKLSGQAFFKMAENGDILFAYINTKEAILYRPSTDKIIQVAAINVGDTVPQDVSGVVGEGAAGAEASVGAEAAGVPGPETE